MLAALLLCTAWASQAQNLTVKVNDQSPLTGQASLQAVIEASNVQLADITSIEITAGSFSTEDWNYLKDSKHDLSSLESFTITDGISSVADMPNLFWSSYFSSSISSVSINAEFVVGNFAFYNCYNLSFISLPAATSIGHEAFRYCGALTTVSLPAATSIGSNAFWYCSALTTLKLGATPPPTIGSDIFFGCPSPRYLKLVDADGNPLSGDARTTAVNSYKGIDDGYTDDDLWYGWCIAVQPTQLTVKVNGGSELQGNSLQEIVADCGVAADAIKELEIVSGDFLGRDVLYMRSLSVEKLTMSAEIDELGVRFERSTLREFNGSNVKRIGELAFAYCDALTTVSLPVATDIGDYAFVDCYALSTVSLPAATSIGLQAFEYCSALTTVSLPAATSIGHNAFYGCSALTTVSLPAATSIGYGAFYGCSALTSLELGATPSTVQSDAFSGCPSPRYLSLVDADGNPLTGTERTTALANYMADANWDNTTSTWAGWNLMLSISAMATPAEGGSVSGTGSTASGSTVTLEATPNEGYRFVRWTDGTNELSTDNPYSFTATDDAELVAEFEEILYTLSYTASEGGSISGTATQTVREGQSGSEVEAVPAEGYRFVRWSDDVLTAKRTDSDVQGDMSVTAIFELIPTYTLSYTAGDNGNISGTTPQTVREGESGTEVEAVPAEGYRFVRWSDDVLTAKRTDSDVQGDMSVTAIFELIPTYTLTYTATTGGSVTGSTTQTVREGESGTEVEAVPAEGYKFLRWSDGLTTTKRTDSNVRANLSVTAEFIDANINIYTLTYTASKGGSIKGTATQNVITGQSGTEVEAVANEGYRFVKWSDGLTTAKRTDSNVNADISVTAEFAIITYTLSYTAGEGGSITGQATQSVQHGQSGTEVEAVPNAGYRFVQWSDGLTTAKRTDSNVQGNINAMAEFEKTNTTGIFNSKFESLSAYPNPTTGRLWVSVPEPVEGTAANVLVYNTAGKLLQRIPAHGASAGSAASRLSIDLSGYPDGMYFIHVGNAVAKVVKR